MVASAAAGGRTLSQLSVRAVNGVARRSFLFARAHYKLSLLDAVKINPVIVYTVGKVGSSSVAATLEALLGKRKVAHVHYLTPENLRADEARYRSRARRYWGTSRVSRFLPRYVWLGQHLNRAMASAPSDMVWNVVTLVRDPVRRDVSSFFQNLELMFDVWPADELRSRSAEDVAASLVELFLDTYVGSNSPREFDADPLTWFDTELKQVFGVDVFAKPFPVSRGYDRYSSANARVLLLRLEDLDRVARTAFAEFLGATVEKVVQSNDAADKVYSAVYSRFKSLLELPSEYLDRMYCSSYSKHFYSEQELAGFRSRWE